MSAAAPPAARIPTYVEGLDPRLGGGVPPGSVVVIEGSAGCMKSTLAYSILYRNAIEKGSNGLYITIEQPRKDIEEHMAGVGMDKTARGVGDKLAIIDLGELRSFLSEAGEDELKADWFKSVLNQIHSYRRNHPLDLVVLDSLNGLFALTQDPNPRLELFHFIKDLKTLPITVFLISEVSANAPISESLAGFLADGIIRLEAKRQDDMVNLQLGVVKMRKAAHDHSFFPFMIRKGGFEVVVR